MANPVLVEVLRGGHVESRHRGAVAACDADGRAVLAIGDTEFPVFPRSAVKALQTLPFLETGAADAFGFGAREIALAQASHRGEPAHVETAARMLRAIGLDETALECGVHWPSNTVAARELAKAGGVPNQLHNNCSGKHANFLSVARHFGIDHSGYVSARHPVQELVREALENVTGASHAADQCGTDGCSIPTYAVPLPALARGFARFATGKGLAPGRAAAARRIFQAAVSEPFFVAGTDRFDTDATALLGGAALLKTGAEGVYCAALPELGLGVAIKCDDGATRASVAIMAAVLAHLMPERAEALRRWTEAPVLTRRQTTAGQVKARQIAEVA